MVVAIAFNGQPVSLEQATVPALDRGLLFGDGVFVTLRVEQGIVLDRDDYLLQLERAAAGEQLWCPTRDELVRTTEQLLAHCQQLAERQRASTSNVDLRLKWVVTRGAGGWSELPNPNQPGNWLVMVASAGSRPVSITAVVDPEPVAPRLRPLYKLLSYHDSTSAKRFALRSGVEEVVRCFPDQTVAEGSSCNLFAISRGILHTPPGVGIVAGVTRASVIKLAHGLGLGVSESRIALTDFLAADEWFATNSQIGVCPMIQIGPHHRDVGEITAQICASYDQRISEQIRQFGGEKRQRLR